MYTYNSADSILPATSEDDDAEGIREHRLMPYILWIIIGSDRQPETKQGIEGKLLGSDREGLGLGVRIADLNQIANLKLSILAPVKFRSPI